MTKIATNPKLVTEGIRVIAKMHGWEYRREPSPHLWLNDEIRDLPDDVIRGYMADNDLEGLTRHVEGLME